jgi:hypothetical protein
MMALALTACGELFTGPRSGLEPGGVPPGHFVAILEATDSMPSAGGLVTLRLRVIGQQPASIGSFAAHLTFDPSAFAAVEPAATRSALHAMSSEMAVISSAEVGRLLKASGTIAQVPASDRSLMPALAAFDLPTSATALFARKSRDIGSKGGVPGAVSVASSPATSVTPTQVPPAGLHLVNVSSPGSVRAAGVAPSGFADGILFEVQVRALRPGSLASVVLEIDELSDLGFMSRLPVTSFTRVPFSQHPQ